MILQLVVLSTLYIIGYAHPKRYYHLVENICVYLQAKNQLLPPLYAKICELLTLSTLGMPGTHTQYDSINMQKSSMFIYKLKINLIIHFFLEVLHFKESFNLIG